MKNVMLTIFFGMRDKIYEEFMRTFLVLTIR